MAAIKSARGVLIDFDTLKIKQSIASAPKPATVKAREDYIDQKFKRNKVKKLTRQVTESVKAPTKSQQPTDETNSEE